MSTVFWVRHGPTHADHFVGWIDIPADLSDTAQIARLDAHLPGDALLVSSDLIRSVATADAIVAGRTRLPHDAALREMDFGDWDGRKFGDIAKADPELSRDFWTNPGDIQAPNGESWNQTKSRISGAVDRLMAAHPDRDLILVAHFGAILCHVQHVTGMAAQAAMAFKIDNLSVTTLNHSDGHWRVLGVNHCP